MLANVDIGSLIVTISREIGLTQSSDLSNIVFMFTIQPSQINILSFILDSFFLKDYINFLLICGVRHCPSDEVESEDHHKDYLMIIVSSPQFPTVTWSWRTGPWANVTHSVSSGWSRQRWAFHFLIKYYLVSKWNNDFPQTSGSKVAATFAFLITSNFSNMFC